MDRDLDPAEVRVLGCLIEKQHTTPDAYPLSLNALRLACNQSTNRDPVVTYDEETIRAALSHLSRRRLTRLASGHTSRAAKYRHLLAEEERLDDGEQALLAVLALRGPQTPGELRARSERLHPFADAAALQEVLTRLIERGLALQLARRPGQKEERFIHRLSEDADGADAAPAVAAAATVAAAPRPPVAAAPVDGGRHERELAELRAELAGLREQVEALRGQASELAGQVAALRAELGS